MQIYDYFIKEIKQQPIGVLCSYRYKKEDFVAIEVGKEIYEVLSKHIIEMTMDQKDLQTVNQLFEDMNCKFLLMMWKEQEENRLYFISDESRVRALEFMDFFIPEYGLVKGDAKKAGGRISSTILQVEMEDLDVDDTICYFLKRIDSYFQDCDLIYADEFGEKNREEIMQFDKYHKKRIPWAFVRSKDLVPNGNLFRIRTLENEEGILIKPDQDIYIMIGCRGEAYDIRRSVFEDTYIATDEPLDVFEQMLEFLPEAELISSGEFISLDEKATLCYPKVGEFIYAKKLSRRTKVFSDKNAQEYYLGKIGDYLAIRSTNTSDIYVIQEAVFYKTYEQF